MRRPLKSCIVPGYLLAGLVYQGKLFFSPFSVSGSLELNGHLPPGLLVQFSQRPDEVLREHNQLCLTATKR
ncbi:hypothetical protein ACERSW_004788 [Salmonella enterica]